MRKNTLIIVMILSMFIFSLQMAEPLTAASLKVVDHGSIKFKVHNNAGTYTWKTYQKGNNYVKVVGYLYSPSTKRGVYIYNYFEKVSKTKLRNHGKDVVKYYDYGTSQTINIGSTYTHTKLTAAQYYWKVYRPFMIKYVKTL